jgi:hypothetical protein
MIGYGGEDLADRQGQARLVFSLIKRIQGIVNGSQ